MSANPLFPPDSKCVSNVCKTPNHGERSSGIPLDMIILHYTGMPTGKSALDWLCNLQSGVSCHYFVDEDGAITQLVPEARRAWHAGKSCWKGHGDINSRSIGIEIVNPGHQYGYRKFPSQQIDAVIELCLDCGERLRVLPQYVLAHSDIAPHRKEDPGEMFPWGRLHKAGIGHWVEPESIRSGICLKKGDTGRKVKALQSLLAQYGYGVELTGVFGDNTVVCTAAFQRHFRPAKVDGKADNSTLQTLRRLLANLPEE